MTLSLLTLIDFLLYPQPSRTETLDSLATAPQPSPTQNPIKHPLEHGQKKKKKKEQSSTYSPTIFEKTETKASTESLNSDPETEPPGHHTKTLNRPLNTKLRAQTLGLSLSTLKHKTEQIKQKTKPPSKTKPKQNRSFIVRFATIGAPLRETRPRSEKRGS